MTVVYPKKTFLNVYIEAKVM